MKKITIVVPCYNEESMINTFYQETIKHLHDNYIFNFLFIDDGSKDNTLRLVKELAIKDKRVKYISFSRNFGKEAAILAGLQGAMDLNSNAVIILDADLQDPPSLIPEMIQFYEEGYKHIYAKHRVRIGEPKLKTFFAKAFYKTYAIFTKDKNMAQGARDFSLMDKVVVEAFLEIEDYERFTKGISSWVGFEKKCIEYDYVPRVAGTTKWSFKKLFSYGMLGIKQFSRVYLLITRIAVLLSFIYFAGDIIYSILNQNYYIKGFIFKFFIFLFFLCIHFLMKLMYDIRDQVSNRPKYLIQYSNIHEK